MRKIAFILLLLSAFCLVSCGKESSESSRKTDLSSQTSESATHNPQPTETLQPEASQKPFYLTCKEKKEYSDMMIRDISKWKDKNGGYSYPKSVKEFCKTSTDLAERYASCQIPDKLLKKISTRDLFLLIADCPERQVFYLTDVYEGDGYESALKFLINWSNGIVELLDREDCEEVVQKYYDSLSKKKLREIEKDKEKDETWYMAFDEKTFQKKKRELFAHSLALAILYRYSGEILY